MNNMTDMNKLNEMVACYRTRMEEATRNLEYLQHNMESLKAAMASAEERKFRLSLELNNTLCQLACTREELNRIQCDLDYLMEKQERSQMDN